MKKLTKAIIAALGISLGVAAIYENKKEYHPKVQKIYTYEEAAIPGKDFNRLWVCFAKDLCPDPLKRKLLLEPKSPLEEKFEKGIEEFKNGNYAKAAEIIENVIDEYLKLFENKNSQFFDKLNGQYRSFFLSDLSSLYAALIDCLLEINPDNALEKLSELEGIIESTQGRGSEGIKKDFKAYRQDVLARYMASKLK